MSWSHRILAHEHHDETFFQVHEVYYDENNKPNEYTENGVSVGGCNIKEITWTLYRMLECRKRPIIWAGDRFPDEYPILS